MLIAPLGRRRPGCCGVASPSVVISVGPVCLVHDKLLGLLQPSLRVSGAEKEWGPEKEISVLGGQYPAV